MNCWLIRAGQQSRHAVRFATHDVVAVGWSDIDGLRDLRGLSKAKILDRLHDAGREGAPAACDAEELMAFCYQVKVGDIVITPDAPARELLVGEITGEYTYADPSPVQDYHHVRTVEWYGRCSRDDLPESMEKLTWYRRTILQLLVNEDPWVELAERMKSGEATPVLHRRGSHKSPRATGAVRRPTLPSAEQRLCPGCGYSWPVGQFVAGSELCRGCR